MHTAGKIDGPCPDDNLVAGCVQQAVGVCGIVLGDGLHGHVWSNFVQPSPTSST